jgi:peptidoglycan/LPS O-acetylase OafA/YrhL
MEAIEPLTRAFCERALDPLVGTGRFDFVEWRGLVIAGALTYPLYLLHQQIGFIAIQHLHTRIPALPLVLGLFLAMLAASYLIHRLVERPGSRWLGKELTRSLEAMRRD